MNSLQTLYLATLFLAGIALAARVPAAAVAGRSGRPGTVSMALVGLTLALLCVGLVSRTMLRHALQVLPLVLALVLVLRGSPHGTVAAVPLFSFWLGLMVSIWLFLLGVARVFGGTFTAIEMTLTVIIGAASAAGMIAAMRHPTRLGLVRRVATAVVFSVIQFASFWFSMQPFAAFR